MKVTLLVALGLFGLTQHPESRAQFVKGNEAVTVMADGQKRVETPPIPPAGLSAPCPADKAGCVASGWRMVETAEGHRAQPVGRGPATEPPRLPWLIRESGKCSRYRRAASKRRNSRISQSEAVRSASGMNSFPKCSTPSQKNM